MGQMWNKMTASLGTIRVAYCSPDHSGFELASLSEHEAKYRIHCILFAILGFKMACNQRLGLPNSIQK